MGEYLKRGGESVVEWLVRMFNRRFRKGGVPKEFIFWMEFAFMVANGL